MTFTISRETPLQDDVRTLVADLNAFLQPLSPPEFQFQLTVEQMDDLSTHLFVVREPSGRAVGMGALKSHANNGDVERLGELKRMYTVPEMRGKRLGRLIVERLEDEARALGLTRLKLETGPPDTMEGAHRLYRRCGYTPCNAFLDYPESPYSFYYEKSLTDERSA